MTIAAENVSQIAEHAIVNLPIAVMTVVVTIHVVEEVHVAIESVMHVAKPFVVACLNSFLLYSVIFFVPTIRPSHDMLKFLESYKIKKLVTIFNNILKNDQGSLNEQSEDQAVHRALADVRQVKLTMLLSMIFI